MCFQKVFFRDGFSQTSELKFIIFLLKINYLTNITVGTLGTLNPSGCPGVEFPSQS